MSLPHQVIVTGYGRKLQPEALQKFPWVVKE